MKKQSHNRIGFGLAVGTLCAIIIGTLGWHLLQKPAVDAPPAEEPTIVYPNVRLSEIMASNNVFPAGDGGLYDWVELYNPTGEDIDLSGWFLSDKATELRYRFPDGTLLSAGEFFVIYCSGDVSQDDIAPFGISAGGDESIYLFASDGTEIDKVSLPALSKGFSYQRSGDLWEITTAPTPGAANVYVPVAEAVADSPVVISELMASGAIVLRDEDGEYSDWIELCNTGTSPVDISGWFLSDDPAELLQWRLPELVLEPEQYVVIFCSGKDRVTGELHTNFSLFRDSGGVFLSTPAGGLADVLVYDAMEKDQVFRRTDAGTEYTYEATPGYPNTAAGLEAFLAAHDTPGDIVINEAVAYNNTNFTDEHRNSHDWVELKNISDHPVSLSEYTLTNDALTPSLYHLPNVTLNPGQLYTLFCAEDPTPGRVSSYAPFNISTHGERLYLYAADGALSDSVYIRGLTYGGSIGRMEGEHGFFLFEKPTPGKQNTDGARQKSGDVTANLASGIYNDVESLTLTLEGDGEIYYTTDGSVPSRTSQIYTEPIVLEKTSVIRAAVIAEGAAVGDTASFSYIINENHTLPVLSLVCDPRGFRGVYGLVTMECEGVLSLFTDEGEEFSRGCSIRLHGASSRTSRSKKMLVTEFNNRFGGNLEYDVFHNGEITEFSSLMLRGETAQSNLLLKDSVGAIVANRVCDSVLTLQNRYCILYVNGEYYGIYPLREDYSRQYVASHTGSTPESVYVVKAPVRTYDAPETEISDIVENISSWNMADPEKYAWAAERLDMSAMADWLLLEAYFNNLDTGGNIRYIYGDNTGGKWRPGFFDLDIAMVNRTPSFQPVLYDGDQVNVLVQSLVASPEFQALIAERAVVLLENGLADNLTLDVIEECIAELEPEIERDAKRWKYPVSEWTFGIQSLRGYFTDARIELYIQEISNLLRLTPEEQQELFGRFL